MTPPVSEEDTFQILIATDNHLGYLERDPIRGDDSLKTFEEILSIANEKDVDFILLGGDLFHENKPSRRCLHSCMTLLRKYCMGDRAVQFEFVSDQSVNFRYNSFPSVNYEDPNLNISIPVFSIHGNHDDPAGSGSYSAMDLLSTSGLVNYFGKCVELQNIQVSPILLQKGNTKLALYGLGSIRDERLHRLFKEGHISMLRPKTDTDDWFNIFVIHQNRAHHGPTNYIPGNFLDDFLDLVVWGHEHECILEPKYFEWPDHQGFYISQPGSSVATSLSPGETVPKHVGLLQVNKKSFKMVKIPLKTVRPFFIENISLGQTGLDTNSPDISNQLMEYCKEQVEALLEKAERDRTDEEQPDKPLIRLRVEYTDNRETFNIHRFGQLFLNKVANPKDIVLFHKKRIISDKKEVDFNRDHLEELLESVAMDTTRVEDIVKDYFASTEDAAKLSLLSENGLNCAVKEFVDKEERDAIDTLMKHVLKKVKAHLKPLEITQDSIDTEIERFTAERKQDPEGEIKDIESTLAQSRKGAKNNDVSMDGSGDMEDDDDEDARPARGRGSRGGRGRARGSRARGGGRGRGVKKVFDEEDDDEDTETEATSTSSRRGSRGGTRGARGSKGKGAKSKMNTLDVSVKKNGKGKSRGYLVSESEEDDLF